MKLRSFWIITLLILLSTACAKANLGSKQIKVNIIVDGKNQEIITTAGQSVGNILSDNGIVLNSLDKIEPPSYFILENDAVIKIIRVTEEFEVTEQSIPFEHQTVQNESLPEGQTLLIQPGLNGTQQVTYRRILEDGSETSKSIFQITTIVEPVPEIIMVGVHAPFTSISIPGKLAYLIAGNAWVMEGSTGNRRPVVTTGDLDGYVFTISPDGDWLLFTRKLSSDEENINSLWVMDIKHEGSRAIDLKVKNIYHFADWVANLDNTITYSTVEPRESPPGWQANNDLYILSFTSNGTIMRNDQIVETNSGGTYGWWGTNFMWSPNSKFLAYLRPDGIGTIDLEKGEFILIKEILPYNTESDWAWIPEIGWSPDSRMIYYVEHGDQPGLTQSEKSTRFDLKAMTITSHDTYPLIQESGMFASPAPSPFYNDQHFFIAWMQAIFPNQSDTSRYKLMIMDRDGSNKRNLFPKEGLIGLEPQVVKWAPSVNEDNALLLGLIYQGNIWIIDSSNGDQFQITGDGLISAIDWK